MAESRVHDKAVSAHGQALSDYDQAAQDAQAATLVYEAALTEAQLNTKPIRD
ncbi:hypothetical protein [Microbacterium mitrae]|uniref:hypothetical protein n=1 Tax=Microbacterium mitrae TaxID=664640 RepID=UPI00164F8630|nr:hypothetical protein [Microbacterium mitrae]